MGPLAWGNLVTTISTSNDKSRKLSLKRGFGTARHVCTGIKKPELRKALIRWEETGCNHLEKSFKSILEVRAKIVRLSGFRNFLDLETAGSMMPKKAYGHYKMLSAQSAVAFVDELRAQSQPLIDSTMIKLRQLSMEDEDFQGLSNRASQPGNAIEGANLLNWGDVSYYAMRAQYSICPSAQHKAACEYFPPNSTTRRLLDMCGQVMGCHSPTCHQKSRKLSRTCT